MTLQQALVKLKSLLKTWGLQPTDWFLCLHYADILQGYKIPYDRNAHIHIMVPYTKVPWGASKKDISGEVAVPIKSKYHKDLQKFIKLTGHDFNFVVEDPLYLNRLVKKYVVNKKINGVIIPMATPVGNLVWDERHMKKYIAGMGPDVVARRLAWRINKLKIAKQIGDKKVAYLCKKTINKYSKYAVSKDDEKLIKNFDKTRLIKGVGAFGGKVIGRVYLITNPDAALPVVKNKIIVSKLTSVKLTPLIKKSKAVITNEGGVLSHAAITCRELKIPCVIGTKIATKVLKDGDMVEVDANNGIVKKI